MNKHLHISDVRRMLDSGQPVELVYVKKNGTLARMEHAVSLRYDFFTGLRTVKLLRNGQKRTIRDVCIIGINDFEVFL